jgi:hypothetical protein
MAKVTFDEHQIKPKSLMTINADGGVVLIGGSSNGTFLNTLYYLPHAGKGAQWEKLPQQLATARGYHAATLVPDEVMKSCSRS